MDAHTNNNSQCSSDNYLSDSKRACPMDPSDNLSLLTAASHES